MPPIDTVGRAGEAELEKQAEQSTDAGSNDVKDESPRQLHGWKVRQPHYTFVDLPF